MTNLAPSPAFPGPGGYGVGRHFVFDGNDFFFHPRIGGHGDGAITHQIEGKLEVITRNCSSEEDTYAHASDYLEEIRCALAQLRFELGL